MLIVLVKGGFNSDVAQNVKEGESSNLIAQVMPQDLLEFWHGFRALDVFCYPLLVSGEEDLMSLTDPKNNSYQAVQAHV